MVKRIGYITLTVAVIGGAIAGWAYYPRWVENRILQEIVSDDADIRASAWSWLTAIDQETGEPRAAGLIGRINTVVDEAGVSEALMTASLELRSIGLWGWGYQPAHMVEQELQLRASGTSLADYDLVLATLDSRGPSTSRVDSARLYEWMLSRSFDARQRDRIVESAGARLKSNQLREVLTEASRVGTGVVSRSHALALWWLGGASVDLSGVPSDSDDFEALLLARFTGRVWQQLTEYREELDEQGVRIPEAYILSRQGASPGRLQRLQELAGSGDVSAETALRELDAEQHLADLTDIVQNPEHALSTRRLAAWQIPSVDIGTVTALLEPVAEADGSVYTAAVLAERFLPHGGAVTLAETWISSFDDDEKRAGAVLAVLLGVHGDLLETAYGTEDIPKVKTTQRNALFALGRPVGDEDPILFASRTLNHDQNTNSVNPDTLLCLLATGDTESLALLTTRPDLEAIPESVQWREWLIERFVPHWHERAGRTLGGNERGINLHFDALRILRLITTKDLRFDRKQRVFVHTPTG